VLAIDGVGAPPADSYVRPDARLNLDPAAPVIIYCQDYGIDVYAPQPGGPYGLALQVLNAEIDAWGVPAENALLDATADGRVRLYRLSTGEFQVNAYHGDEEYIAIWVGCPASGAELTVNSLTTGEQLFQGWSSGNWEAGAYPMPVVPPLDPNALGNPVPTATPVWTALPTSTLAPAATMTATATASSTPFSTPTATVTSTPTSTPTPSPTLGP
jgi:hypothetical protein